MEHSSRIQVLLNCSRKRIKEGKGLSKAAFWKAVRQRAKKRNQPK